MQMLTPGATVRVRRRRWRVVDVRAFEDCRLVTLAALDASCPGVERRVLTPFDTIEPIARHAHLRRVRSRRWRRACRALIASETPPGTLRSACRARMDLLPHQLEPALAIVRGLGCRVLLADEVGLGKTIQAGVIAAELVARGAIDRILILAPAGLREQWRSELQDRFDLAFTIADAQTVRMTAATLPIDVNPWTTMPLAIASVDYVKRPEVLPAVAACRWDLVIVDEAHGAAASSDRHDAVRRLSARASYVLLLTATPHSGDVRSFQSLCTVGRVDDDSLLIFRRTRQDAGLPTHRRVHTLMVRSTPAEQRMHHLLQKYSDAVRAENGDAWLALSVLHKRALSSAWALAESVDRRLGALENAPDADQARQLALPLADGEFTSEDEAPAWPAAIALSDPDRDRRLLRSLAAAARLAAAHESKVAALTRWLRRAVQPALVFTEYRDTLHHLRSQIPGPLIVLHGGMTREERRRALDEFARSRAGVMLATDAAGEGLNLQHACRLVINLELPWNPMRLEQRIGRVDRIGQSRTVHAVHLIADGTGETRLLSRLRDRVARAQSHIGAADPFGSHDERDAAHLVVVGDTGRGDTPAAPALSGDSLRRPDLKSAGSHETDRVMAARRWASADDEAQVGDVCGKGPWIGRLRSKTRRQLRDRRTEIWRVAAEDAAGRAIESTTIALAIRGDERSVTSALADAAAGWRRAAQSVADRVTACRLAREQAIVAAAAEQATVLFQPGLFDRRGDRAHAGDTAAREEFLRDIADRTARVRRSGALAIAPPQLLLVLTS
jgi:superfamily II DNA or RNA helicase